MIENNVGIDTSTWVDDYADILFNYANVRLNDQDLAKDLVQDTFVSALKGIDRFQGKSTIIDHWRKQESRKTKPMSFFTSEGMMRGGFLEGFQPQGRLSEIDTEIENTELREAIAGCINLLPAKWKGIVLDKMVEGKESEEVCKEHDITPSNLWVIMHRAKLQLRDCLEKKWFA